MYIASLPYKSSRINSKQWIIFRICEYTYFLNSNIIVINLIIIVIYYLCNLYRTELTDNITHVIVWFTNIRRQDKKITVDLVPKEWLLKVKRTWFCKYPSKSDYDKVQEWSKECKAPELIWKKYPVKVIKDASKYPVNTVM